MLGNKFTSQLTFDKAGRWVEPLEKEGLNLLKNSRRRVSPRAADYDEFAESDPLELLRLRKINIVRNKAMKKRQPSNSVIVS